MTTSVRFTFGLVLLLVTSCASPSLHPYPHYLPSRESLLTRVQRVAFIPTFYDESDEKVRDLNDKVGRLVAQKLGTLRIETIHHRYWSECWTRGVEQVGGLFDPKTGAEDKAKAESIWSACATRMHQEHGVDSIVDTYIFVTKADLQADQARWHGVEEDLRSFGERFLSAGSYSGTVPAASLLVRISDIRGTKLFENAGGIEVLSDISGGALVDRADALQDWSRIARATDIVFEPLIPSTDPM